MRKAVRQLDKCRINIRQAVAPILLKAGAVVQTVLGAIGGKIALRFRLVRQASVGTVKSASLKICLTIWNPPVP